jgi:putative transposase
VVKPAQKREVVDYLKEEHQFGIRQACKEVNLQTSSYYYQSHPRDDRSLIDQLNKLAQEHPTYGFPKMYSMLRYQGFKWNNKRVKRVYKYMKLNMIRKRKRRLPVREKQTLSVPMGMNHTWSMDFMHDALFNTRTFRTLNIIDDYNREALWIEIGLSIGAKSVVDVLDFLITERGKPKEIRVDNGPEFTSVYFENWCHKHRIQIKFTQPGKPTQNAFIERFNRSYRSEVLDLRRFESVEQVRQITHEWIEHYNQHRPHKSLGEIPPAVYLLKEKNSPHLQAKTEFFPVQQVKHQHHLYV